MGRPKLERVKLEARVAKDTPRLLKELALKHGFKWGAEGNPGKFLDAIASGELKKIKEIIRN